MGDRVNRERQARASVGGGGLRALAAALAVVLLAGGLTVWAMFHPDSILLLPFLSPSPAEDWSRTVACVPLDDRTDNLEDVELLAEASGWTILLPDRDWFRTALDGQLRNANGSGHGNREALLEWVREQDALGCDRFVLSLDQLFSGGLVHSRTISEPWPLTFSDGTTLDEAEAFRQYILPLAEDPANRLYLFDSVLRLSPTVGYQGVTEGEYYALREYGMTERPRSEDTLKDVFAQYPRGEDGVTAAEDTIENDRFRPLLTEDLLDWYLSVRRRKLALTDSFLDALSTLSQKDNVYLLIGIDDSSNRPNIQYNELRYLERRLKEAGLTMAGTVTGTDKENQLTEGAAFTETAAKADFLTETASLTEAVSSASRGRLMAGLDSLARLLLCRMAWEEYGREPVKASVRYIGGTEEQHSSEFDLYTLEDVAELHLDLFGAERVSEKDAELQFVVMTAPAEPGKAAAYREELLSLLEENILRHIPTVLDEASNNAYGDELEQELLDRIPFASLVGYAGKYDQANVTGAAFAMGFSRYLYLKYGRETPETDGQTASGRRTDTAAARKPDTAATRPTDAETEAGPTMDPERRADLAQLRQLANSMALTEYILHVRAPLNEYLGKLGMDWNNLRYTPANGRSKILGELERLFRPDLERVCENLRRTPLLTGVSPWQEREAGDVTITDLYFPWDRTFEVAFTVEASDGMEESGNGQREP